MRINTSLLLQLIAGICVNVTVATGDYDQLLVIGMTCSALAVLLLIQPLLCSTIWNRLLCVLIALPTLYVLSEFTRRASFLR